MRRKYIGRAIIIASTFGVHKAVVPFGLTAQKVGALIEDHAVNQIPSWEKSDVLSWGYLDEIGTLF